MSVAVAPAETLAKEVQVAVESAATTSVETLNLLRALLGLDLLPRNASKHERTIKTGRAPSKAPGPHNNAKKRHAKATKATDFAIYEPSPNAAPVLSRERRLKLATATFNKTLKILSEAAKARIDEGVKRNTSARGLEVEDQTTQTPLQSRSPNRRARATEGKAVQLRHLYPFGHGPSQVEATGACACAALESLRQLKPQEQIRGAHRDLSLERGSLILLDKLTTLKLAESATREGLALRKRLQQIFTVHNDNRTVPEPKIEEREADQPTSLIEALAFDYASLDADLLNIIISFQHQILRIGNFHEQKFISELLLKHLDPRNELSPCAVILHCVKSNSISAANAGKYLYNLSQDVLRLVTSCSLDPKVSASTERIAFLLSCVALKMRIHCWSLVPREPNLSMELWSPLAKILAKCGQWTSTTRQDALKCVRATVQDMQDALRAGNHPMALSDSVSTQLAELAQRCGQTADALSFLDNCGHLQMDEGIVYTTRECLKATLLLDAADKDTEVTLSQSELAFRLLSRSLKGSPAEMHNLLIQGAKLRNAASSTALAIEKLLAQGPVEELQSRLQTCAIKINYAYVRLILRYLDPPAESSLQSTSDDKFSHRLRAAKSVIEKSLQNLLVVVKCSAAGTPSLWEDTEGCLGDALNLARLNESVLKLPASTVDAPATPTAFTRISNVFWAQYLRDRDTAHTLHSTRLVRLSIESVSNRPYHEQQHAFIHLKYERLAFLYSDSGAFSKAAEVLNNSIEWYIGSGVLADAVELVLAGSLKNAWGDSNAMVFSFGKALSALSKLSIKYADAEFYDQHDISAAHRAVLLEKQAMAFFVSISTEDAAIRALQIARQVLGLYREPIFRVCRLRFASNLLRSFSKTDYLPLLDPLLEDLHAALLLEGSMTSTNTFLSMLFSELREEVALQLAFLSDRPSPGLLEKGVDTISSLLWICQDVNALETCVEDVGYLLSQLQLVSDYSALLGLNYLTLKTAQLVRHLLEIQNTTDFPALVLCLTQIALSSSRLGFTVDAGRAFAAAEKYLEDDKCQSGIALQWKLAHAEYLLDLSNAQDCSATFQKAKLEYEASCSEHRVDRSRRVQLMQDATLSHLVLLASQMALQQGDLRHAIVYARQSVRLSTGVWVSLEHLWAHAEEYAISENNLQGLTADMSNMTLSFVQGSSRLSQGIKFWPHVNTHIRALLHMSNLSAHAGLFQDAVFYAEQAKKISMTIGSEGYANLAQSAIAVLQSSGTSPCKALKYLEATKPSNGARLMGLDDGQTELNLAIAFRAARDGGQAKQHLENARKILLAPFQASINTTMSLPVNGRQTLESKAAIDRSRIIAASRAPSRVAAPHSRTPKPTSAKNSKQTTFPDESTRPQAMSGSFRRKGLLEMADVIEMEILLESGEIDLAAARLAVKDATTDLVARKAFVEASVLFSQASKLFSGDAVHCVLSETALAFPAIYRTGRPSGNLIPQLTLAPTKSVARSRTTNAKAPKKAVQGDVANNIPQDLINKARTILNKSIQRQPNTGSTDVVHNIAKLSSMLDILSSVLPKPILCSPGQIPSQSLLPKNIAIEREAHMIHAERTLSDASATQKWPELVLTNSCRPGVLSTSASQQVDLAGLPDSWHVVSLSLSEDKSEFLLSRVSHSSSPFSLRIPLCRSNSGNSNDDVFSFDEAKTELLDIIKNANLTAQDKRGQADKNTRREWWAEREALDQRLEALLSTIESIWLGGFRGILSAPQTEQKLLSRFGESLVQSLDKHLPSRQQRTSAAGKKAFQLHAHILDLFVALGHPDDGELDDSIIDLLYFVVDVLQFRGERNAYDEIDFDLIMLDVLDALRSYHESVSTSPVKEQHTILILDKDLHAFPWESLPCLFDHSVSRMPSMSCIQRRLATLKSQQLNPDGISISSTSGSYILNPSSDLSSTESTFSHLFADMLPSYPSIVSRPPTESEFSNFLASSSLCLYFGHGSGAQYIRARTIRKMERCAVTFLMGCSSGKMTECGAFESYGVPWNYMHAGSGAVVGTLWDVTDRDIDRFALKAFTEWGLLDEVRVEELEKERETQGVGGGKTKKKKSPVKFRSGRKDKGGAGRGKSGRDSRQRVALDEAVCTAREACVLRYLNGAAPVIYGIPIFLE